MAPKNNKRVLRKKAFLKSTKQPKKVNSGTAEEIDDITDTEKEISTSEKNKSLITTVNLEESMNNLENTPTFNKISLKMESTKSRIHILGEVLVLLKSNDSKNEFKSTLQSIFKLMDIEDTRKRDNIHWILTAFVDNLKDINEMQDLASVAETCFDLLLPNKLLSILTTENDNLKEGLVIGTGGFGIVRKGTFCRKNGSEIVVAIKSPIDHEESLRREAIILSQLDHKNIVKLIAFQKSPTKLIMEFMENRGLKDILVRNTDSKEYFYAWIMQILNAMEYIAEKQIVHRDLAIKNIFVNSEMLCKVGDFGLSCFAGYNNGVYEQKIGELGGYNISPESRHTQLFTTKSDVWAMGLLIWEMYFTIINQKKYLSEVQFIYYLLLNCMFEPLPNIPRSLYHYIILNITNDDPQRRPTFTEIKEFLISHENVFFN